MTTILIGGVLTADENQHMGHGPTFYNLQLYGEYPGAEETFQQILLDSNACTDLRVYTSRVDVGEVLICHGEMFAPHEIYGQVILSSQVPEVFMQKLALEAGWVCEKS
ncbi:MAG: hypothetical protein AB8C84_10915 [Oligoflexales bacterium]